MRLSLRVPSPISQGHTTPTMWAWEKWVFNHSYNSAEIASACLGVIPKLRSRAYLRKHQGRRIFIHVRRIIMVSRILSNNMIQRTKKALSIWSPQEIMRKKVKTRGFWQIKFEKNALGGPLIKVCGNFFFSKKNIKKNFIYYKLRALR